MSNAKRCDRCGNYYQIDISNDEDNLVAIEFIDKYGRGQGKLDLCRECRRELSDWLEKGKENCDNCAFKHLSRSHPPCDSCSGYNNWTACK